MSRKKKKKKKKTAPRWFEKQEKILGATGGSWKSKKMETTVFQSNISIFHKFLDLLISSILNSNKEKKIYLASTKIRTRISSSTNWTTQTNSWPKQGSGVSFSSVSTHRDGDPGLNHGTGEIFISFKLTTIAYRRTVWKPHFQLL